MVLFCTFVISQNGLEILLLIFSNNLCSKLVVYFVYFCFLCVNWWWDVWFLLFHHHLSCLPPLYGLPGGSAGQESACPDVGLIPGSRSSGEGNGNSLRCSCLENPTDKAAWWATVDGVAKRVRHYWTTKHACTSPLKCQPSFAFSWRWCLRWGLGSFWQVNSVFWVSHIFTYY